MEYEYQSRYDASEPTQNVQCSFALFMNQDLFVLWTPKPEKSGHNEVDEETSICLQNYFLLDNI